MRFVTIEPAHTRWTLVETQDMRNLYAALGLGDNVDHGVILPVNASSARTGIAVVVDGFSLFLPPEKQRYFSIGRQLFGGNAILYGFNEAGETVDLHEVPVVVFMTVPGIEDAIERGQIDRPSSAVNGVTYWQWPQATPFQ